MTKDTDIKGERIEFVENEGVVFIKYYDGKTHGDENYCGEKIERPNITYLDSELDEWILNVEDRKDAYKWVDRYAKEGIKAKVGPHGPETEVLGEVKLPNGRIVMDGITVPNTKPTIGVWKVTSEEEKDKYRKLLTMSQEQNKTIKMTLSKPFNE